MTTDRTPQVDDSLLSAPLAWLTGWVLRAPMSVIAVAAVLAAAALALAAARLDFRTSRLDLLDPNSSYNKLWIDYLDEFGEGDDAVVVVQGASREEVVPVLDALAQLLVSESSLFEAVLHEVDLSRLRAKGLYYLPVEQLDHIEHSLDQFAPVIHGDWSPLRVDRQLAAAAYAPSAQRDRLAESLSSALAGPAGDYVSPWPLAGEGLAAIREIGSEHLLTNEGRLGFILLRLRRHESGFVQGTAAIDHLRALIAQTRARHPGVSIGVTGLPVMENDEMRSSQSDMLRASLLSLAGVACLFMAGLGGVRHPLMTVLTLMLAMAWSFGYLTLAIGHLNILSVSFGVILIGLGIDFGVHYVARYLQLRRDGSESEAALVQTARSVGPGVVTGGMTTSIAFFAAYFTNFTGVAELGMIAGGGILLCLAAAVIVLPAMILLSERRADGCLPAEPLRVDRWIAPLTRFHGISLPIAICLTGAVSLGISHVTYDHNLLNLQPEGLESVELERMLLGESQHSVWYAISISDSREELLRRKQAYSRLASVERTEEIVSLIPVDHEAKGPIISRIYERLENLPQRPPQIPVADPATLGQALAAAASAIHGDSLEGPAEGHAASGRLDRSRQSLAHMPPQEAYARVWDYQQRLAGDLLEQLHLLRSAAEPAPPALDDLPPSLVARFVGRNQRHLLKIYGRGDIWDMDVLKGFVADVKSVDPDATGQPLQTYFASRQMQRSYVLAAVYALAAVTVVLLLDFRSMAMTLLALLPVVLGMVQLFGLMGLVGIPLNPANLIVLPLILGIGLDDGVHVVHDFRQQRGRYRLSGSTATAVLVTSLTTMAGFGSLMIASHQGLQSLGRVLVLGVSCCMISSLVILPALLRWMSGQDETAADEQTGGESAGTILQMASEPRDETPAFISPKRRAA